MLAKLGLAIGLCVAVVAQSACTVRPLYASLPISADGSKVKDALAEIAIQPVTTRLGQEVRNHLIFSFTGGKGESVTPRYTLELVVTSVEESAATIQIANLSEPTAATIIVIARYMLTDVDGIKVSEGTREIASSFDVPAQEFAAMRARRDAENRAARELAELLRLAISQQLALR